MAAKACDLGRIEAGGRGVKASREVKEGHLLRIRNGAGQFEVEVLRVTETRGPAAVAQTLYEETEASRESRRKLAEERRAAPPLEDQRYGKPSKRDRRELARLKGRR